MLRKRMNLLPKIIKGLKLLFQPLFREIQCFRGTKVFDNLRDSFTFFWQIYSDDSRWEAPHKILKFSKNYEIFAKIYGKLP